MGRLEHDAGADDRVAEEGAASLVDEAPRCQLAAQELGKGVDLPEAASQGEVSP